MKITIEGTHQDKGTIVTVQKDSDDIVISEVIGLIADALKAWGFDFDSISRDLGVEYDITDGN